jgi:hypothetical protein
LPGAGAATAVDAEEGLEQHQLGFRVNGGDAKPGRGPQMRSVRKAYGDAWAAAMDMECAVHGDGAQSPCRRPCAARPGGARRPGRR